MEIPDESEEGEALERFVARTELDVIPMDTFSLLSKADQKAIKALETLRVVGAIKGEGSLHDRLKDITVQIHEITDELIMAAHERKSSLISRVNDATDPIDRLEAEKELNQCFTDWQSKS